MSMRKILRPVDMRSDTFTKPDVAMLDAMRNAEVGDDCYGEDPTVNELQTYTAQYFGKEAALFMPTGTMSNLVGMMSLLNGVSGEVIIDKSFHINFFESDQMASFAGVIFNMCKAEGGIITVDKLKKVIDSKCRTSPLYPKPKILVIENTINSHGGKVFPLDVLKELYAYTSANGILLYMDGARLFEACVATGVDAKEYAKYTDALSVCFSKGLGAPMGSMLLGKQEIIDRAKNHRKHVGGSFHQAGFMAATGLHAIQHNLPKLQASHDNIRLLADALKQLPGIQLVNAETNMILIDVKGLGVDAKQFVALAKERGVLLIAWQENVVRFVTHLNVSREDVLRAQQIVTKLAQQLMLPVADREVSKPTDSAETLLAMLKEKSVACEKSDKNPQIIRIQLDGKARRFFDRANKAGLEVSVASKNVVEVMVTAEFTQADLLDISDTLSSVYGHYNKSAAVVSSSSSNAGMFGSHSHHQHKHHHHRHHHKERIQSGYELLQSSESRSFFTR